MAGSGSAVYRDLLNAPRRTLGLDEIIAGMQIDPSDVTIFRGGSSLQAHPIDFKIDKATGLVKTTHGLSLDVSAEAMGRFWRNVSNRQSSRRFEDHSARQKVRALRDLPTSPITPERFQECPKSNIRTSSQRSQLRTAKSRLSATGNTWSHSNWERIERSWLLEKGTSNLFSKNIWWVYHTPDLPAGNRALNCRSLSNRMPLAETSAVFVFGSSAAAPDRFGSTSVRDRERHTSWLAASKVVPQATT